MVAGVAVLAAGGWGVWLLRGQLQQTAAQLSATQRSLADTQHTLQQLETAHQELTASHDSVTRQWETTTSQLHEVNARYTQATQQLTSLDHQNEELTTQLEAARQQAATLEEEMQRLANEHAALKDDTTELTTRVTQLQHQATISPDELRQLQAHIAQQEAHAQSIEERLLSLSLAHDRLLEEQAARAPSFAEANAAAQAQPREGDKAAISRGKQDAKRLAAIYRELAESYLALRHYPKAARTFERSLTFEDEPDVHARLSLIYSRFLHDAVHAKRHADLSLDPRHAVAASAISPADAYSLPREDGPLVWEWLID